MAFSQVNNLYGEAAILDGQPDIVGNLDCVYRPFTPGLFLSEDPSWGIYNLNGTLVSAAAYARGSERALIGQSMSVPPETGPIPHIDEEHIYFGPIISHYGHFIVTSLARTWYIQEHHRKKMKLLCHSDHDVAAHFRGYMGRMIDGLELQAEQFTLPKRPTRFTKLTIPHVAFFEQNYAYAAFLEPMYKIGDSVLRGDLLDDSDKPIYLSKSNLQAGSVSSIRNEAEIVERLHENGVEICFPEQLNFRDQVRLFSSRRKILGFAGSAFHNHIFSRRPPRMTCVTLHPVVNSNLILLDLLHGAEATYHFPEGNISEVDAPGFLIGREIIDVQRFVADLMETAEIPKGLNIHSWRVSSLDINSHTVYHDNCVPDHRGDDYKNILSVLHADLGNPAYLEVGTLTGSTLALSNSPSIAIDPEFQVSTQVIGAKKICLFYQMESDSFFLRYDPKVLLGSPVVFAFLDGMHRCEYLLRDFINCERHASRDGVIALHDCLPVDVPMTDRTQNGTPPAVPHRGGWWTGDVWRTIAVLKKHRPDLRIISLDASPTGLVLISNLDPISSHLSDEYDNIVKEMHNLDLATITVKKFLESVNLQSTNDFREPGALLTALGVQSRQFAKT